MTLMIWLYLNDVLLIICFSGNICWNCFTPIIIYHIFNFTINLNQFCHPGQKGVLILHLILLLLFCILSALFTNMHGAQIVFSVLPASARVSFEHPDRGFYRGVQLGAKRAHHLRSIKTIISCECQVLRFRYSSNEHSYNCYNINVLHL